jgi:hypothetical protein
MRYASVTLQRSQPALQTAPRRCNAQRSFKLLDAGALRVQADELHELPDGLRGERFGHGRASLRWLSRHQSMNCAFKSLIAAK